MGTLTFWGIREPVPGPRWRRQLDATWSGYRGWYVGHGAGARPTLATAADMLGRHMPELVPTWRRLVDLAAGDETARVTGEAVGTAARILADHSSWTGVAEIAGTSRQAAWERWRDR